MHIDIQARDFALTKALRLHIEKRLSFALSTRYDHIKRIMVRLSDINGPRGGNDKRCQLHVVLPGQQDVVIEDTQPDLYMAIDRAADRAPAWRARAATDDHFRGWPARPCPQAPQCSQSKSAAPRH